MSKLFTSRMIRLPHLVALVLASVALSLGAWEAWAICCGGGGGGRGRQQQVGGVSINTDGVLSNAELDATNSYAACIGLVGAWARKPHA